MSDQRPTVTFVLEQTLGHVTHAQNLQHLVPGDDRIAPVFLPIRYETDGWAARLPVYSNWTVRAGVRTRRALRHAGRLRRPQALFIHTQVMSVFAARWMKRIPTIVSVDATPIQIDALGEHYAHERSGRYTESLKWRLNRRSFARACHIVCWSEWSKQSLVDDYDVPPAKVTVVPPGVDVPRWSRPEGSPRAAHPAMKILFVGGDLQRKGGALLIEAVRSIRSSPVAGLAPGIELHLVTTADIASEPGIVVHRGLRPNTPELISLYHQADVFCLPTLGDCLPMVLSEAGAAGLPLVATDVGALGEIVQDGVTGLLVERGSIPSLVAALSKLAVEPGLRGVLGANAKSLVHERFDARINSRRIVDVLLDVTQTPPRQTSGLQSSS
jgi:glycosyltransferase involved in cell wall biosynthesis